MTKILNFVEWFSKLGPTDLDSMNEFYSDDVYFKDPFNEFEGIVRLTRIFEHMFDNLDQPRFKILEVVTQEEASFLTWDFIFSLKGKDYSIHGSTHVKFNDSGLVYYHRDYWDVGEELLLKIPFIKFFYKKLITKLEVK